MLVTYFINTLNQIISLFQIIGFVGFFIASFVGAFAYLDNEFNTTQIKIIKTSFIVGVISLILLTFIPTEKTAYMMAGVYVAQEIAESPVTAQIVDKAGNRINRIIDGTDEINGKVYKIINQKLDSYIAEQTATIENKQ
jgi:hypothetical protein